MITQGDRLNDTVSCLSLCFIEMGNVMAKAFGEMLREFRFRRDYGLREFAEIIGELPSNYSAIESGTRKPWKDLRKITQVAEALSLINGSSECDMFFIAAQQGTALPPDIQPMLENPLVPALLRTVKEKQLSPQQLRNLIEHIRKLKDPKK
jgi:transcriptional regulator with XRE-family HTH domain